jgi:hypothetical protein
VFFAGRVSETKDISLFGSKDVMGCGTGGEVADGADSFNEFGAVSSLGRWSGRVLEGFRGRVGGAEGISKAWLDKSSNSV